MISDCHQRIGETEKKKLVRVMALVLVLSVIVALFMGCDAFFKSDEEQITDRLDAFMSACNSGDLDGALDCMDKSSRNTYGAVFDIGSALFGSITGIEIDVRDLMAVVLGFSPQDFFELQIQRISLDSEETATVTASISFTDPQTGEKVSQEGLELPMIKEGWDWYIDARIDWYALMEELS